MSQTFRPPIRAWRQALHTVRAYNGCETSILALSNLQLLLYIYDRQLGRWEPKIGVCTIY